MKGRLFSILGLLAGCSEAPQPPPLAPEPWPNEAEVVFQEAEVLKHSLEQQKLEARWQQELSLPDDHLPGSADTGQPEKQPQ